MLNYELSIILHEFGPYLIAVFCVIVGILIDRAYWKPRIYRYADREIVRTLEYQANRIEKLEEQLREKKEIISDLRGYMRIAKKSALRIMGVVEK